MKKITLSVVLAFAAVTMISSCKKGEGDPSISLRSRTSRLAGEWDVTSFESSRTSQTIPASGTTTTSTSNTTHDGKSVTITTTYPNSAGKLITVTSTGSVNAHTVSFDKEGAYKSTYDYTVTSVETENDYFIAGNTRTKTTVTTTITTDDGVWNFLGKIGDAKNKEYINVSVLNSSSKVTSNQSITYTNSMFTNSTSQNIDEDSYSYAKNENTLVWKLTQLKNKETKVEAEVDYSSSGTNSTTSGGTTTTTVNTKYTTEGTTKLTLSAK